MPDRPTTIAQPPTKRSRTPAKVAWDLANPSLTVHPSAAQGARIAAEADATGTSKAAVLLAAWEEKERAVAAANSQGLAEGKELQRRVAKRELADRDREHRTAMAVLRRDYKARLEADAKAVQADVDAAYRQGLSEADPALQTEVRIARLELRRYAAIFDAYEKGRANLGRLVDQVLVSLGDWLTDPEERTLYRQYAELIHKQVDKFDHQLDIALRPIPGADVGWLDRHELEVGAKQRAATARATREAIEDRTQTSKLIGEQLEAADDDGDKRARAELDPEIARLQAELEDALAKLADLGPVQEELAAVTAELAGLKQELVEAGWAGREAYVLSIVDGLRKPLADRLPFASPDQYRIP